MVLSKGKTGYKEKRNGRVMLIAISDVKIDGITVKQLTGIAILKNTNREKKICTFRVFPKYREQGIGSMLLNICFKYLGTTKPLISISSLSRDAFTHIIEKYKWELYETLPDFYQKGVTEYVFNGFLSNNDHRKKLIFRTNKEVL